MGANGCIHHIHLWIKPQNLWAKRFHGQCQELPAARPDSQMLKGLRREACSKVRMHIAWAPKKAARGWHTWTTIPPKAQTRNQKKIPSTWQSNIQREYKIHIYIHNCTCTCTLKIHERILCMYIYICICVCVHTYICRCTCIWICLLSYIMMILYMYIRRCFDRLVVHTFGHCSWSDKFNHRGPSLRREGLKLVRGVLFASWCYQSIIYWFCRHFSRLNSQFQSMAKMDQHLSHSRILNQRP